MFCAANVAAEASSEIVHGPKVVFEIPLFGGISITETTVIGWVLIAVIFFLCLWLTHDLKKVPEKKRQVIAEMAVEFVNNMVKTSMGEKFMGYAPYIAALIVFSASGSLVGLLGLRSMTADINVTATWALMTFALITYNKFRANGALGYLKSFTKPIFLLAPINILSEVATPASMAFRHFGNIAGGMVITTLLYMALGALSNLLHLEFVLGPFTLDVAAVGIPAVLSVYFDLFSACIQAYIFSTLTMVYVSSAAE